MPCRYSSATWGTSPYGAHPWLHAKPLDAAIGQVPMRYRPSGTMVDDFEKKTTKTQLLPSFRMVEQQKKAIEYQDL